MMATKTSAICKSWFLIVACHFSTFKTDGVVLNQIKDESGLFLPRYKIPCSNKNLKVPFIEINLLYHSAKDLLLSALSAKVDSPLFFKHHILTHIMESFASQLETLVRNVLKSLIVVLLDTFSRAVVIFTRYLFMSFFN